VHSRFFALITQDVLERKIGGPIWLNGVLVTDLWR
jgi:hypothetical protein